MKLEKLTVKELTALKAQIEKRLPEAKAEAIAEAKKNVAELAKKHGFDLKELITSPSGKRRKRNIRQWRDQKTGVIYRGIGRKPPNFDMSRAVQIAG